MYSITNNTQNQPRTGKDAFLQNWNTVTEQLRAHSVFHFAVPEQHRYKVGIPQQSLAGLRASIQHLAMQRGIIVDYQFHQDWHRYIPFFTPMQIFGRYARYRIYRKCILGGRELYGTTFGCIVEVWKEQSIFLVSDYGNSIASRILAGQFTSACDLDLITPIHKSHRDEQSALLASFPIDIVYTWVDGSDPQWRESRNSHRALSVVFKDRHQSSDSESRYLDRGELRFSLRSLCMYADFFRYIYIVTSGQVPSWLKTSHPSIRVIPHEAIFQSTEALPTFNSHAIESQLHHIDGLSEHFIYLNDDCFFLRPKCPEDFFTANGLAKIAFSKHNIPARFENKMDRPIDTANQNTQSLIKERFGIYPTHKPQHAPHALLRSLISNLEKEYSHLFEATSQSRFRSAEDISVASSLFGYYALGLGKAITSSIISRYVDINDLLFPLLTRPRYLCKNYDTLCLNEVDKGNMPMQLRDWLVSRLLQRLYPIASPFELLDSPTTKPTMATNTYAD